MRVGFVTGEYPPMQGGVGAFTREVARAMAADGHEVFVFTRQEVQGADEAHITISPTVGIKWDWRSVPAIKKWVAANRIDVINIQFQTAAFNMHPAIHWIPKQFSDTPVVVTFHDLRVPYLFPKAGMMRPGIVKMLARDSDANIATDRADETTLREQWRLPKTYWIPIGSNIAESPPSDYDREAWRQKLGVNPDDLLISYFGFLNESKGGLVLIQALRKLLDSGLPAKLVMIGGRAGASDPTNLHYGQALDNKVSELGIKDDIIWTGFVNDDEVSAHFLASDLTALPYLDGVSLRRGTLMAALVHGRAIITTHPETNAPELDGVLKTVQAGDSHALAEGIRMVWQDQTYREELAQASRNTARAFEWDNIAKQTIKVFEALQRK